HPPEAALEAVDAEAIRRPPVAERVDVEVPHLAERHATLPEAPQSIDPLRARRENRHHYSGRDRPGTGGDGPCEEKDRADEEQRGAHRAHLEDRLDVIHAVRQRSGRGGGQQEIRPVIVNRPVRQVGVARWRGELRQLRGQRLVPDELGGEVGAVVTVSRRVAGPGTYEWWNRNREREQHDAQKRRAV